MSSSTMTVITQGDPSKPKLDFYEKMMGRLMVGEPASDVFGECCTEDLVFTNPEFHVISPDKSLYGFFALETMSRYYRTDGEGWRHITMKTIWSEETETTLFRERNFIASEPFGTFGGFEEGERADDLEVVLRVVEIVKFRDGKVSEIHAVYDSLGFYYDMAGGDWDLVAKAIKNSQYWWAPQLENVKNGLYPIPDPGQVYGT